METINTKELGDKDIYPDDEILRKVLGNAFPSYLMLLELFGRNEMTHEWRYYNDGKAWLCKVQKKKRTIVWMSAWKGYIQAAIYFPEKYLDSLYSLSIDNDQIDKIKNTKICSFQFSEKASMIYNFTKHKKNL